ncbi:MAG: type I methionyl aminopeptidase [Elusimicrobia bacterium CG08_land_8_20_14_0_20_44_26]|nr:MAG: type I methionyl aminopeptidase [Elusimicrobia bacterium CG08_land_8_20_14_0_20_44_26]
MLSQYAVEGKTTADLAKLADNFIYVNSVESAFKAEGFPASICTSPNDEVVHGIPGAYVLKNGDILGIDIGIILDGFYSDMAFTVGIGSISSVAQNLLDVTKESLFKGIDKFRRGMHLGDISNAISSFVEANSFSVVRQFTGHGIGFALHEEPQILNYGRKGTGPELENGMVFALEPMVNEGAWEVKIDKNGWTARTADGRLSAHYEHTVALLNGEPEILTNDIGK